MATEYALFDYHYTGSFDRNGILKKVYNIDALENAIRMWFISELGEVVRLPLLGGYLTNMLFKPMNDYWANEHAIKIESGFIYNFQPYSKVSNIKVVPNYEQRTWEVDMDIYTPVLDYVYHFSVGIRNQS